MMAVKLTPAQQQVIERMELGYANIRDTKDESKVTVKPYTTEYSKDGFAIVASRVVLRDGRSGADGRFDWRSEMYRIQKDGKVSRL